MGVIVNKALALIRLLFRALVDVGAAQRLLATGEVKRGVERLVRLHASAVEFRTPVRFTESDLRLLTEAAENKYKEQKAERVLLPMRNTGRAIKHWVWLWHSAAGAPQLKAQLVASGFPERLLPQ